VGGGGGAQNCTVGGVGGAGWFEEELELVPLAKVVRGWGERPLTVGCAS
jgi:hypothetical protein